MAYKCPRCGSLAISKFSSPVTPKVTDMLECDDCDCMWPTKEGEEKLRQAIAEIEEGKTVPFDEVFGNFTA